MLSYIRILTNILLHHRPNNGGSLPIILEGLSLIEDVTGFDGDPGEPLG